MHWNSNDAGSGAQVGVEALCTAYWAMPWHTLKKIFVKDSYKWSNKWGGQATQFLRFYSPPYNIILDGSQNET